MTYGITRERSLELLHQHLNSPNLIKHCLASEAVMRALARHFSEDEELWGLTGLLHDLDVELTLDDMSQHTHETIRILRDEGVAEEILEAIRMHNEQAHGDKRTERFHQALAAGETITGLIIAAALVYPDKKLASVKPKSVRKRYKEKQFAAGADRSIIAECEQFGLPIPDFCDLCLEAMQGIADDLGL
ncbi:MAG: HDIG domain-containing protein [Deltaproteobacteria bacterium]|jgi:putative nucleotidyltransferase with HDIG domain|nr:HDIG domain-containing protein [Deltaproteobacteria bacterium]MCW8892125.1 HDIG domain-containing protein [Deltaproteobacteria bacterium]MCW9050639.1 HDIG domain-containing protein [Deltaproteobacteria bacterium]